MMRRASAGFLSSRNCWNRFTAALLMVALASASQTHAQTQTQLLQLPHTQPAPTHDESVWLAASDQTLDTLRGGFNLGMGLTASFGISRAVYINGQLITSTTLQVGDLASLTPAQANALSQQISMQTRAQLVQNGPGNTVEMNVGTVSLATYIQNTVNDQSIRSQTIIDVGSNSMSIVKGLNLQATINEAIVNAIGMR